MYVKPVLSLLFVEHEYLSCCLRFRPEICVLKVLLKESMSQIFYLGLRFDLVKKRGNFWLFLTTFFSRLHKIDTRT